MDWQNWSKHTSRIGGNPVFDWIRKVHSIEAIITWQEIQTWLINTECFTFNWQCWGNINTHESRHIVWKNVSNHFFSLYQIQMYKQRKFLLKQLISIHKNFVRYLIRRPTSARHTNLCLSASMFWPKEVALLSLYQLMSHTLEQLVRLVLYVSAHFPFWKNPLDVSNCIIL